MINSEDIKYIPQYKCLGYIDKKTNSLVRIETRIYGDGIRISMHLDLLEDSGKTIKKNVVKRDYAIENSIDDSTYGAFVELFLSEHVSLQRLRAGL